MKRNGSFSRLDKALRRGKDFTFLLTLLSLFFSHGAQAGVNLKNGNFYISYDDNEVLTPDVKLTIGRTYNSKSTEVGTFGYGWGFYYDTRLENTGEGTLRLVHYGSGGVWLFNPVKGGAMSVRACVDSLTRVALKYEVIESNPVSVMKFTHELRSDATARSKYLKRFVQQGWLLPHPIAEGTVFESASTTEQIIYRNGVFVYYESDGNTQVFNEQGQFIRQTYLNADPVVIERKGEQISAIVQGKVRFKFSYNKRGQLESIRSPGGKSSYWFDDRNNLIHSIDAGDNEYWYEYDLWHNMIAIRYTDGTAMYMSYDPASMYISRVINRDRDTTFYEYGYFFDELGRENDDHYFTRVRSRGYEGEWRTNYYEYEIRTTLRGESYTYRILTEINGIKTETHYNDRGLPVRITRGHAWTRFEYNQKGLVTLKETSGGELIRMSYNEMDKITEVINSDGVSRFEYNEKGELIYATNEQDTVSLFYNRKGKIVRMRTQDTEISFEYNKIGKPSVITIEGVGSIKVKYDNNGEILKVESKDGHQMALQVTQAFQKLLNVVKPSGVNLGM